MTLMPRFIELLAGREEVTRAGLVVDARSGEFLADSARVLSDLRAAGHSIEVLFLDAPDEVLLRRFSETVAASPGGNRYSCGDSRRTHAPGGSPAEATAVIDTAELTVHGLRAIVLGRYGRAEGNLSVTMESFGFKYGLPTEADIVLDVRFLPNPFFVAALAPLSGEDESVRRLSWTTRDTDFPGQGRGVARAVYCRVRTRRQDLRHRGHRVHRWPPSLGRHRGRAGASAANLPRRRPAPGYRAESPRFA